ncbi:cobalt ABC transporter ATP-binding protein [Ammoniphilus oxalaticus]|uniref:Cobalt ABC transporter ATP-binding protein n=1 Tax=Ammoniphilus oxalaticus TaxID=66863 RepID=A0A419SF88_9BACL|nr:ATP-binding cassette domain-containing protein [Ammoniphilus oxalaticus]RKD22085.1 cobalt ABC transporter ATP-binding protein [Ammoniphilus oxalaticus]
MEAYRIEHVNFTYPEADEQALKDVTLIIESGEFVTVCGRSGSGKSTLLRHLKPVHTPHGKRTGDIFFFQEPLEKLDPRRQVSEIGFVFQNPDNQLVTEKVWHELAFGLESLGYDQQAIRLRVAEMASYFGIHTWFHQKVTDLSGGQKQILNLASIMAMQPAALVLDEPTSQLDPIAAANFLDTLKKINRELGVTIILSEHRLEEVAPISDRLFVMDEGRLIADGTPREVGVRLNQINHPMFWAMPTALRLAKGVEDAADCPLTINEGRRWIDHYMKDKQHHYTAPAGQEGDALESNKPVIELKEVWFRYEKKSTDIIKDLSLTIRQGEFCCIVGGNGVGKSTALSVISGLNTPYRGRVFLHGKEARKIPVKERFTNNLGILPQDPKSLFLKKTVELDLREMIAESRMSEEERERRIRDALALAELEDKRSMHPYDLSGGEQQRAALAKVLLLEPQILLLDEPTKGLDAFYKEKFAEMLLKLKQQGVTIVMVSHDIEFCAKFADTCALFFDGSIVTKNETRMFFAGNSFYTTAANRIARHICQEVVTTEDVIELCRTSS